MRVATQKSTSVLRKQAVTPFRKPTTKSDDPEVKTRSKLQEGVLGDEEQKNDPPALSDSLAICLFGFTRSMYVSEDEEEVRKRVIMSEVLPDEVMWAAWAKNEAPLRQGRGWYPALDRHFLELLVISEIHCLANPLNGLGVTGTAERVHRHATRVRRVACERIGAERLHAYCERVKEAFEAYMHGAWGAAVRGGYGQVGSVSEDGEEESSEEESVSAGSEGGGVGDEVAEGAESEERGRSKDKGPGSVKREPGRDVVDAEVDKGVEKHSDAVATEIPTDPFGDDMVVDHSTTLGEEFDEDDLMKIDLADVEEKDEDVTSKVSSVADALLDKASDDMVIDITLDDPAQTAASLARTTA